MRELDIGAIGENGVMLDQWPDLFKIHRTQIVHEDNALRIAHRQASDFNQVSTEVERITDNFFERWTERHRYRLAREHWSPHVELELEARALARDQSSVLYAGSCGNSDIRFAPQARV